MWENTSEVQRLGSVFWPPLLGSWSQKAEGGKFGAFKPNLSGQSNRSVELSLMTNVPTTLFAGLFMSGSLWSRASLASAALLAWASASVWKKGTDHYLSFQS